MIEWVFERPLACAALSSLSLIDMANCIHEKHTDWWIPAGVALFFAVFVRPNQPQQR